MKSYKFTQKKYGLYALAIFVFSFPILEGLSNSYIAVGTIFLGFMLCVVWAIESLIRNSIYFNKSSIVLGAFCCLALFSILWTNSFESSTDRALRVFLVWTFYVIICDVVRTRKMLRIITNCYIGGVLVLALSSINNINAGLTYQGLSNRFSASGLDPNNFGLILCSAIPLLYLNVIKNNSGLTKIVINCIALIFAGLVVSTASRAAVIALILMAPFIAVVIIGKRYAIRGILSLILIAFVFSVALKDYIPESALKRLTEAGMRSKYGYDRFFLWEKVLKLSSDNIVFGRGTGSGKIFSMGEIHNTFLSSLYELGVIGLVLWVSFWGIHLRQCARMIQVRGDVIGKLLPLCIIPVAIAACSLNWEIRKSLYLVLGLCAAYHHVLFHEKR